MSEDEIRIESVTWAQEMAEHFGYEAGSAMLAAHTGLAQVPDIGANITKGAAQSARLAAHFGRIALGQSMAIDYAVVLLDGSREVHSRTLA